VSTAVPLARLEQIIDRSQAAGRIEALLPVGVRRRQLSRVHQALTSLPETERIRLGVVAGWKHGPHVLTYRQVERTFHLVVCALEKEHPDGAPSAVLAATLDALLEASIPPGQKNTTRALAVDWSDLETFSCPPPAKGGDCADPEASRGHRRGNSPGQKDELFYGYYISAATIVREENGPAVPELARRMTLTSCHLDPAPAMVPVLECLPGSGVPLGDIPGDSGYAHRAPENWAVPLRAAGASLIQDLHPHDRGPKGTYAGATISNGNLYCPATPRSLLELGPLARNATPEEVTAHDQQTAETARYKLGKITADDNDGYHRVMCPAVLGKLRCPLRPDSMTLDYQRPHILAPPEHPPPCCTQQTITVPPEVHAKTAQKHDYPSQSHRRSYARRSAAERTFSTTKDPASNDISRGWCRLMGLTPIVLLAASMLIVRNQRILSAWDTRQADNDQRAAAGLPPKTRRRRRKTLASLAATPP
jgi:hypothetical protein